MNVHAFEALVRIEPSLPVTLVNLLIKTSKCSEGAGVGFCDVSGY